MDDELRGALAQARALGFLGPGPLEAHEESAAAFIEALGSLSGVALDLGSGGGVPGLLLAAHYQDVAWVLLDQHRRRTSFLAHRVATLGWSSRVTVRRAAAEDAAHEPGLRGVFAAVVARSFGRPAATAECAVAFLRLGGRLAVAEPPEGGEQVRWPAPALASLGLRPAAEPARIATFELITSPPAHIPRSRKTIERAPLW